LQKVKDQIWDAFWSGPISDTLQIGEISLSIKNKSSHEAVGLYVENWFPNLMNKFKEPVSQLKNFEAVTDNSEIFREAISKADEAVKNFQTGLKKLEEKDHDIWRDYTDEKRWAEATFKLQELLTKSFDPVNKEIPNLQKKTAEKLKKIQKDKDELEPRIKSIVSQLGPVPVILTDFIVLFPLFIVALMVMITAALHKSSYLYISFWQEFSRENKTMDRRAFQQFADCWYLPPNTSFVQLLLLIALLVVISGMFIRAGLLVVLNADAEMFNFLFPAEGSSTKIIFTGAYIFGTLVIVGCFGLIFRNFRRITHELIE
jgi:hypothetical protein